MLCFFLVIFVGAMRVAVTNMTRAMRKRMAMKTLV